jgi:hypothetical protein
LGCPSPEGAACETINIEKSTTGGTAGSWTQSINGIDTSDRVEFIPPLAIDPSQPTNLYFGTSRLYHHKCGGKLGGDLRGT